MLNNMEEHQHRSVENIDPQKRTLIDGACNSVQRCLRVSKTSSDDDFGFGRKNSLLLRQNCVGNFAASF